MPQTIDRIDFACADVDPNQWPKLRCGGANQLALEAGSLRLEANRELLFEANGQLRSFDDNHRLVFNRAGNLLELHEAGDIRFLTGAPAPTEKLRIRADGKVGLGTASPTEALEVNDAVKAADFIKGTTPLVSSQWADVAGGINYAGGSVGIGTGNPDAKLQVGGGGSSIDLIVNGRLQSNNNDGGLWAASDRFVGGVATNQIGFWNNGAWRLTVQNNGDVAITGKLGTLGWSPVPRTPGWGGGIHTWDVEAEGTMWSRAGYQSGNRDLAENYASAMALEPGDVVCLDQGEDKVVLSGQPNDLRLIGVVSTAPGVLLNENHDPEAGKLFPIALCGRVPCKVVAENGPIQRGDLLTSSSRPGRAKKAQPLVVGGQTFYQPGTILGKAMGALVAAEGVIDILVTIS